MQHVFGYACVSAVDRNLDTQLDDLTRAGFPRIFQDKVTSVRVSNPALDEMLTMLCEDDIVVVNRLARLGNSMIIYRCWCFVLAYFYRYNRYLIPDEYALI